jgi:ubiquinone/menaquinone biosynthesis C-methylase UbiE
MTTPNKPEKPNTYFVQNRSNQDELRRLQVQGQMLTSAMGGVLPEQPDPTIFRSVLDVGCGTGEWLIELAKNVPTITRLVGVDVSRTYVEYARAQAEAAGVSDRVEFHTMDALLILDFRDHSFDLINHRSGSSWLRTWDWPKLLSEYRRVSHWNGMVRITEPGMAVKSDSPALTRLSNVFVQALYQAGHLFAPTGEGLTDELTRLLHQHGVQNVQTRASAIEYLPDSPQRQTLLEDARLLYRVSVPFLRKWTKVPEEYEQIYQQAMSDMEQLDFRATVITLLTAWGKV